MAVVNVESIPRVRLAVYRLLLRSVLSSVNGLVVVGRVPPHSTRTSPSETMGVLRRRLEGIVRRRPLRIRRLKPREFKLKISENQKRHELNLRKPLQSLSYLAPP